MPRNSDNGTVRSQAPPRRHKRRLSPLVADAARLAKLLCCGLRSIRTWAAAGRLPKPIKLGVRVVWVVSEIRGWLKAGAPPRTEWEALKGAESNPRRR
jgi:predicted DNA-binding transcriptional regulator AlpA